MVARTVAVGVLLLVALASLPGPQALGADVVPVTSVPSSTPSTTTTSSTTTPSTTTPSTTPSTAPSTTTTPSTVPSTARTTTPSTGPAPASPSPAPARAPATTSISVPPYNPPPWYRSLFPPVTPPPFTGPVGGVKIGVLGDSLLVDSVGTLTTDLQDRGYQASVSSNPGYSTWALVSAAQRMSGQGANVLVVATGTNDMRDVALGYRTLAQTRQAMDQMISLNRVPCIVWVGVNTSNGLHGGAAGTFGDVRVGGPVVNQMIRDAQAASGRPASRTLYASWADRSTGHLDWFRAVDDVHLSPTGAAQYRRLILDAVASCRSSLTTVVNQYPTTDRSTAKARLDVTSSTVQGYGPSAGYVDLTAFRHGYVGAGDRLVYDVQYYSRAARIGIDLVTTDGQFLRGSKAVDQNRVPAGPANLLDTWAGGRWYTRDIKLPTNFYGRTVDRVLVGAEADSVNAAGAVRQIRIVSPTGALRYTIWDGSAPGAVLYSTAGGTVVTVTAQAATGR